MSIYLRDVTETKSPASVRSEWKVKRHPLGPERPGGEADAPENRWLGWRGLAAIVAVAAILPFPVYWMSGPAPAAVKKVRPTLADWQYVDEEEDELSARSVSHEDSSITSAEEAASALEEAVDADAFGKRLLLKVLDSGEEETKDLTTARFLDDLDYNRAVLHHADLDKIQVERRGKYWLQARAPYQLPPRIEGESGKAGMAQLRLVFMDGRWRVHELNVQ